MMLLALSYILVFIVARRFRANGGRGQSMRIKVDRAMLPSGRPATTGARTNGSVDEASAFRAGDVPGGKQRALYVHARNGLGNRMRAVASAAEAAQVWGRKLVIVWERDRHLDAGFEDLFDNDFEVLDDADALFSESSGRILVRFDYMDPPQRYRFIDLNIQKDVYVSTAFRLNFSGSSAHGYRQALRLLRPVQSVSTALDTFRDLSEVIGVHVRMNSNLRQDVPQLHPEYYPLQTMANIIGAREGCHVQNFVIAMKQILKTRPDQKFFVSTDTPAAYKYLQYLFPAHIVPFDQGCMARGVECVQRALVTIMLLGKCGRLIGSHWSSFTEVARDLSVSTPALETACQVKHPVAGEHASAEDAEFLQARLARTFGVCRPGSLNLVVSYSVAALEMGEALDGADGDALAIRQSEYDATMRHNLEHPAVKSVHVLVQSLEEAKHFNKTISDPCGLVHFHVRPGDHTYGVLLGVAKKGLPDDELVMVMNTDIKIGEGFSAFSLPRPVDRLLVYTLTRWEEFPGNEADGFCGRNLCPSYKNAKGGFMSTDAFIFTNPMPPPVIQAANFTTHWSGAENLLIHIMKGAGYKFENPCYLLRLYHNHCSGVRKWAMKASASKGVAHEWRHNNSNTRIQTRSAALQ